MAKSIKFGDDIYLSAQGVILNDMTLDGHIKRFTAFQIESPIHLESPNSSYCGFILGGFMQNIGMILLAITRSGNTLTVKDLRTMSDFSNPYLNITISNQGGIDVTTGVIAPSQLTAIVF